MDEWCPESGPSLLPTDSSRPLELFTGPLHSLSAQAEALHPLFLSLTAVVQGKFITHIVALKVPEAQEGSDLPKVTQPVRVELGFQGWLCWHGRTGCCTSLVSQAGKN